MAAGVTTSTYAGLLVEMFSRDRVFAPFERSFAKFHDMTQDFPNEAPLGKGRTFPIQTKDPHSTGAASESSGVLPTSRAPEVQQANIDAVQIVAAFSISEFMLAVSQGQGTLGPDGLSNLVEATTRNAVSCINRLSLGHGTGRLAVLEATANSTSQVMRNPEGILQLRANMLVDAYDTDTGGSKQLGASFTIDSLDQDTRTCVFTGALNGTAGWGIYQALTSSVSTYGVAPSGLRAWGDAGTLTSTIATITRASYPGINANVIAAATGTIPYSEKLIRKGINRIKFRCGLQPDVAITNSGIISEHLNHLVGDRVLTLAPGQSTPNYKIGYDQAQIGFQVGGQFIPFIEDTDFPARELVLFKKSMFRRHQLRPLNWIGDDSGADGLAKAALMQLPASGGSYELAKIAGLLAMVNYGNRMPGSICSIRTIADEELAGDTV
jgi:hypothetical protein